MNNPTAGIASIERKKRVAVLEDNQDIREIIEFLLDSENYEVQAFATCSAFMGHAANLNADCFVLDIMLPDGNGLEVCRQLKINPRTTHIPVLMMSANYSTAEVFENCPAQDFIKKPFDILDFVQRIDRQVSPLNSL